MKHSATADRTRRDIVRLCGAGLDARTLQHETLKALRKEVPIDAFWCASADPATLLFTGSVVDEVPERATALFLANEFLQDDVNKFVQLARGSGAVNSLYAATQGKPERSPRYREILAPLGFGDELRAALVADGMCWGFMCLHREQSGSPFTRAEANFLSQLSPHLAAGMRTALLLERSVEPGLAKDAPGLLVLAEDLSVAAMTPAAEQWLAEIADCPRRKELPQAIAAVAVRLQATDPDDAALGDVQPTARIRTRSGQWLALHASHLIGSAGQRQIAVILEVAQPAEVAALLLWVYDLTAREGQVAQLVLQGLLTGEIAQTLCIAPLTVQEHLKSVFDKVGVRSRRELVAHIFAQQRKPRLQADGTSQPQYLSSRRAE